MRPFCYLVLLTFLMVCGPERADAHPRSIGGHAAYSGGAVFESDFQETKSYLSLGLLKGQGRGEDYTGYGAIALLSSTEALIGPEYTSGWSSMFASTGAGIGPVVKIAEAYGGGVQGRLFGDLFGIHGSLGVVLTYSARPQAIVLFSIGVGGAGSHTSFNQ